MPTENFDETLHVQNKFVYLYRTLKKPDTYSFFSILYLSKKRYNFENVLLFCENVLNGKFYHIA